MKKIVWFLWMQGGLLMAQSPDTLDLLECHQMAMQAHPLYKQTALYEKTEALAVQNHQSHWLPALDLNGRFTWQNEVVEFPVQGIPGMDLPSMPHDHYQLTLDVRQALYDGGLSKSAIAMEKVHLEVQRQQVDVRLNRLKEQVNQVYFRIFILQKKKEVMQLKLDELEQRIRMIRSAIRNETRLGSDLLVLEAEQLRLMQQMTEMDIGMQSARSMLSTLIARPVGPASVLTLPATEVKTPVQNNRPELMLYDLQVKQLDARIGLTRRKRIPTAFAFGTFGYGNPALNFFKDEFRTYCILGAGLHWNLWDWSQTSRDSQQLAVQQQLLGTQKEAFEQQIRIHSEERRAEINTYEEAVHRDLEILALREAITRTAGSQLENGLITSSDYLRELNAETEARILLEMHRIQLEMARIAYLTTLGNI